MQANIIYVSIYPIQLFFFIFLEEYSSFLITSIMHQNPSFPHSLHKLEGTEPRVR